MSIDVKITDIEKYDKAVYEYLTYITDKIIYAPTQTAVMQITKREKFSDKKPWNFISFYRASNFSIQWDRMNNPSTVSGDFLRLREVAGVREARYVKTLPVYLTYQVELWASKAVEVQSLAVSLIQKIFMEDQVLKVPINPDGELGRFHILDISWDDNSDLERETEIGKIYRHTVSFTVDSIITLVDDKVTTKFCDVPVDIY